jgi:hypothetical protein
VNPSLTALAGGIVLSFTGVHKQREIGRDVDIERERRLRQFTARQPRLSASLHVAGAASGPEEQGNGERRREQEAVGAGALPIANQRRMSD